MKKTTKKSFGDWNPKLKAFALAVAVLGLAGSGAWGWREYSIQNAQTEALKALQSGFPLVAAGLLDEHPRAHLETVKGCELAVATYSQAGLTNALDQTAQECAFRGRGTPVVAVGIGKAKELRGDEQGAMEYYQTLTSSFDKSPLPHFQMAQLYEKNKKSNDAANAYVEAFKKAPTNQTIALEALKFANRSKIWTPFGPVLQEAEKIETKDPSIVLVIAEGYRNLGDMPRAKIMFQKANGLLGRRPARDRQTVKGIFPELFSAMTGGQQVAPPEPGGAPGQVAMPQPGRPPVRAPSSGIPGKP